VRGLPKFTDANLVVGTEGFSDAGVYRLRDDLLIVQSLDFFPPLVDDPYKFGQIAAANSLSDIFTMGARPVTAMNIVGFPDKELSLDVLAEILQGGAERVLAAGAVIVGGHTVRDAEVKYGLSATGVVSPERLLTNQKARPGDVLVLTKAIGTGYITTAAKGERCPGEVLDAAIASMSMLNKAAAEAAAQHRVHAATDITGFGLAGHATEMADSSGVTITLELSKIPLLPGVVDLATAGNNRTRASGSNRAFAEASLCIEPECDPLLVEIVFDSQTSCGLLLSTPPENAARLIAQAQSGGATASTIVGYVSERQDKSLVLAR
jgi:selenide,water dikinase